MAPDTLASVKLYIRASHNKLDADIQENIDACLEDLKVHGVVHKDDTDPLVLNAVKLWCKSVYTDDTAKAAEYNRRYVALRDSLKVAKGYGWKDGDGNA